MQTFWGDVLANQQAQGIESKNDVGLNANLRSGFKGISQVDSVASAECADGGAVIDNRIKGASLIKNMKSANVDRFNRAKTRFGGFNHAYSEF